MGKKAQVTAFIILGILIVAAFGLFLYARNIGLGISPERFIASKKNAIEDRIDECTKQQAERALDIIAKQGGTFTPTRAKTFNNYRINYLCYNIPGTEQCSNRVLTLRSMEDELSNFLENNLRGCIKLDEFKAGSYSLQPGNLEVSSTIGQNNVLVVVDYPITLQKDQARLTIQRYTTTINVPLGRLYLAAMDILDFETQVGDFDPLPYMLVHNAIRIEKHRPFPDKIYLINARINPSYRFQLAIEGEP